MMKWLSATLVAVMLSACSSSTPQPAYYQIPVTAAPAAALQISDASRPAVWLERVTVADYLAGNGVVYQTSAVKYVIAASNRWASPLEQQLSQAMVSHLSARLPGRLVSLSPTGARPDTLSINVTSFQGRYDGKAVIAGDWTLQQGDRLMRRSFALALPLREEGYESLVKTLGQGWQQVAAEVARQIAQPAFLNAN